MQYYEKEVRMYNLLSKNAAWITIGVLWSVRKSVRRHCVSDSGLRASDESAAERGVMTELDVGGRYKTTDEGSMNLHLHLCSHRPYQYVQIKPLHSSKSMLVKSGEVSPNIPIIFSMSLCFLCTSQNTFALCSITLLQKTDDFVSICSKILT